MGKLENLIESTKLYLDQGKITDPLAYTAIGELLQAVAKNNRQHERVMKMSDKMSVTIIEKKKELENTLEKLKQSQEKLIQAEKMAALGQLITNIAHEINNPVGAIKSSNETVAASLSTLTQTLNNIQNKLSGDESMLFWELLQNEGAGLQSFTLMERRKVVKELISQMDEKSVRLNQNEAKILVDIGILNNLDHFVPLLMHEQKEDILALMNHFVKLKKSVNIISDASEKASKIVFSLKTFAGEDSSGKMVKTDISAGLNTVLTLYQGHLKQNVELVTEFQPVPEIMCYPDDLNQIWTNLIQNALHAMNNMGKLEVRLNQENDHIVVSIKDSGPGIPEDLQEKIFQPFFTTKGGGQGSGLGLEITRRIVEKHKGFLELKSEQGIGACFIVKIPIASSNVRLGFCKPKAE
ncbi:MAG: GHKL domain-containing protein [Deltaproteobacteria bacterium]|jgi:signal transduction histidine kinase|nr:GHKL domain-containing protein [Deltaproteobacteria bacterium]MBT4638916.1 GHKL domain-containing protein [Deltaproteobacteria bacterium]MBT6504870.1 GHKL domain-containing protein [Deltaproteobacteria bacterium]MBT6614647.1 GHKL domain-containing protein [Deltaproteobacteria bacterium]MBT7892020.1 GHKL domain-containing protein [Deltaproteobacteria bacterium]